MTTRQMTDAERQHRWGMVRSTWDVPEVWWYPLEETSRKDVVAFEAPDFHAAVGMAGLRTILATHHIPPIWYFPEFDEYPALELDLSQTEFRSVHATEGYWCDSRLDWLIYASHEESITVGGEWLIGQVQHRWPQWKDHLWKFGTSKP